jgi:predicted murein hydrolase (TIGR00659 family)
MKLLSVLCLAATVAVYWISKRLYRRIPVIWMSPILISPLILIFVLVTFHISYSTYMIAGKWLSYLLEPSTVAFAIPLYKHFSLLKQHAIEILTSVFIGTVAAIVSSFTLASLLKLDLHVIESLVPRSVTTPIAMDISRMLGGNPTITAVFVILTALIGITLGPILIRIFSFRSSIAKGTLFGTGAHGVGTTKAFEFGTIEGTISSISMILAALLSLFIAPLLVSWLERWM